MISGKTILGLPVVFKDIGLIYPPTVKDAISLGGEFSLMCSLLTESEEDIEDTIEEARKKGEVEIKPTDTQPTPYENLFLKAGVDKRLKQLIEKAFFLFMREPVLFLFDIREIIIGKIEEGRRIKEEDFFEFQNLVRAACGKKLVEPTPKDEHPKVTEMKKKQRYRDRVKAKQEAKGGNKNGISFEVAIMSLFHRNIGVTPFNVGDLPYALVSPLNSMGQNKEKYDNDVSSIIAGAKKIKLKYWAYDPEKD